MCDVPVDAPPSALYSVALSLNVSVLPNLYISSSSPTSSDRGVFTSVPIPPDTQLANIPISSTLSAHSLKSHVPELNLLAASSPSLSDDDLLALFLASKRFFPSLKSSSASANAYVSFFTEFVANLPDSHSSSIFFGPTSPTYALLAGTTLQNLSQRVQYQIAGDHENILAALASHLATHPEHASFFLPVGSFTMELYVWALFTV